MKPNKKYESNIFVHFLLNCILKGYLNPNINRLIICGLKPGSLVKVVVWSSLIKNVFTSVNAKYWPMQFLDPPPKGM
jgi:hypothetical protein